MMIYKRLTISLLSQASNLRLVFSLSNQSNQIRCLSIMPTCHNATNRASRSLLSLLSRSIGLEPSTPISNRSNGRTFLSIYARACDSHDFSGHDASNHEIPTFDRLYLVSRDVLVTSASTTFNQSSMNKQYSLSIDENAT